MTHLSDDRTVAKMGHPFRRWFRYLSSTLLTDEIACFLAVERELGAAVLLPAAFILLGAELLLFAVADDANTRCSDACVYQSCLGRVGAILAETNPRESIARFVTPTTFSAKATARPAAA